MTRPAPGISAEATELQLAGEPVRGGHRRRHGRDRRVRRRPADRDVGGVERDNADRLAAISSAMLGLANGVSESYPLGGPDKVIIELEHGYLLVCTISVGCSLGVVASKQASLGTIAYEMAMFANRASAVLSPAGDRGAQELGRAVGTRKGEEAMNGTDSTPPDPTQPAISLLRPYLLASGRSRADRPYTGGRGTGPDQLASTRRHTAASPSSVAISCSCVVRPSRSLRSPRFSGCTSASHACWSRILQIWDTSPSTDPAPSSLRT